MSHSRIDSIADFFTLYQRELLSFVRRRVDCPDAADDILQDTYLRFAGYRSDSTIENPRAFLYRIAANLSADHLRARQRHPSESIESIEAELPADSRQVPETIVEQQQQMDRLYQALNELSPLCREIFILSRFDGLTHVQIARQLNVSVSWVEKNIVQALRHCKQHLRAET